MANRWKRRLPQTIDRLVDALGELGVGQDAETSLAIFGPGRGPSLCLEAALSKLYSDAPEAFPEAGRIGVESAPYGPIASVLGALVSPRRGVSGPGDLLSGAERGLLEELAPMLDFLQRSPYRRGYSRRSTFGSSLCATAALRLYARTMRKIGLPAFVILERIESFPERSLDLLRSLVGERLAGESIMILVAGADLPRYWKGQSPRSLEAAGPGPSAVAQAALRAADALCAPGSSGAPRARRRRRPAAPQARDSAALRGSPRACRGRHRIARCRGPRHLASRVRGAAPQPCGSARASSPTNSWKASCRTRATSPESAPSYTLPSPTSASSRGTSVRGYSRP